MEPQEKWCRGNQGGERKEGGCGHRAGVSERGDWPCMVEGGDVMAAGGEEDNVGLTTFLGAGL